MHLVVPCTCFVEPDRAKCMVYLTVQYPGYPLPSIQISHNHVHHHPQAYTEKDENLSKLLRERWISIVHVGKKDILGFYKSIK